MTHTHAHAILLLDCPCREMDAAEVNQFCADNPGSFTGMSIIQNTNSENGWNLWAKGVFIEKTK